MKCNYTRFRYNCVASWHTSVTRLHNPRHMLELDGNTGSPQVLALLDDSPRLLGLHRNQRCFEVVPMRRLWNAIKRPYCVEVIKQ